MKKGCLRKGDAVCLPKPGAGPLMKDFPIVCVGCSAGGLDAYIRLLKNRPPDMGAAIVIVNHITAVPTQLHEVLPRFTSMPVDLITESLSIQPNRVFIIPTCRRAPSPAAAPISYCRRKKSPAKSCASLALAELGAAR